jgi:hypothetical protein
METYELIKRKDFVRDVGVDRADFIAILLDVEDYIEDLLHKCPLKKRGKKAGFSMPNKVLLCFFIYGITLLFPN